MHRPGIGILCLQETHWNNSEYLLMDEGFLVIMSRSIGSRECAGVGLILSPHARRSVYSFRQASARVTSINVRVPGGEALIISAYASHSGYSYAFRHTFSSNFKNMSRGRRFTGPS